MKPQEAKERFVILRAEGRSYDYIARELHMSKSTCHAWEQEMSNAIAKLKAENLQSLYNAYGMTREARIKSLGGTLAKIDEALGAADLSAMQPKDLLKGKLDYTAALKDEYIAPSAEPVPEEIRPAAILAAFNDLLRRVRAGEVTTEQANKESIVLSNMLRAYEQTELKQKMDALEASLNQRE